MSPWERLLERPRSREHFVQLYQAHPESLIKNVGQYLWQGLKRGQGALVIATAEHSFLFRKYLSQIMDAERAIRDRLLVFCDAHETLSRFTVDGQPDWIRFETVAREAMHLVDVDERTGLRAYGEMVSILWKKKQFSAATRLEQLWNRLLASHSFSLYCSYSIDIFGRDFHPSAVSELLATHTHLIPADTDGGFESALNAAVDELLGAEAKKIRRLTRTHQPAEWGVIPDAEAMLLWLRTNLPIQAEEIVARAQTHYSARAPLTS
jgi:hypothetical protein